MPQTAKNRVSQGVDAGTFAARVVIADLRA